MNLQTRSFCPGFHLTRSLNSSSHFMINPSSSISLDILSNEHRKRGRPWSKLLLACTSRISIWRMRLRSNEFVTLPAAESLQTHHSTLPACAVFACKLGSSHLMFSYSTLLRRPSDLAVAVSAALRLVSCARS